MSTTVAIAGAAATQSTLAAQRAAEARDLACKMTVKNYTHETATVAERQDYAVCIDGMYTTQSEDDGMRVMVALLLIFVVAGFVIGRWRGHELLDGFMGAMGGFLIVLWGFLFLAGLVFVMELWV